MIAILALFITLAPVLSGCGSINPGSGETTQAASTTAGSSQVKVEEPYGFTVFRTAWTDLNDETDPIIQELNKKLNIKIKILTAPYETWIESTISM